MFEFRLADLFYKRINYASIAHPRSCSSAMNAVYKIKSLKLIIMFTCVVIALLALSIFPPSLNQAWATEVEQTKIAINQPILVTEDGQRLTPSKAQLNLDTEVKVSKDLDAACAQTVDFSIGEFFRQNKGTNRGVDDVYYGYRYSMPAEESFSVVVSDGYMIVYIPKEYEAQFGIDIADTAFQNDFLSTLSVLDAAASRGGIEFGTLEDEDIYFTSSKTVVVGDYTYRFAVEIEPGYWYTTVNLAGSDDGSKGALYAEAGVMMNGDDAVIVGKPTGIAALKEFFATLDWSPLWVSLKTTGVAIAIIFVLGLLAAWGTIRVSDRWKGILDTIFTIPMVLPPTVCGFLLLLLFGTSTSAGRWLIDHGIDIVFTWPAAVIACVVVGFPLLYRTARGAFENVDASMLDAARTLGWSEPKIFGKLMLPLAWPSIAAGTVLGFARAMGEFGCTLFFAGNYVGVTQTIPIAIYFDWMSGQTDVALFWVIVVILVSFLVILFINIYSARSQRYKRKVIGK